MYMYMPILRIIIIFIAQLNHTHTNTCYYYIITMEQFLGAKVKHVLACSHFSPWLMCPSLLRSIGYLVKLASYRSHQVVTPKEGREGLCLNCVLLFVIVLLYNGA